MDIISRRDAQAKGLRRFYTGRPCKRDHLAQRFVSSGGCVECVNFKTLPSASARNAAVPPSPLIFPPDIAPTPGMVSYVWSRILARHVEPYAREYERVRAQLPADLGPEAYQEAAAVIHHIDAVLQSRTLRMTAKAGRGTLEAYQAKGWRVDQLVAEGLAEWVLTDTSSAGKVQP